MSRTTVRRRALLAVGGATLAGLAGCLEAVRGRGDDGGGASADTSATDRRSARLPTPVAGDPSAAVTVAVYEDFACPHCKTFNEQVYPRIRSEYVADGRIRYEHHDFPIPVDETVSWRAPNAARAVQATVGNTAFFEYADLLFANQGSLGPDTYASLAGEVGADPDAVRTAAVERRYDPVVEADREHGIERGVRGTPTVFVDGSEVEATYAAISDAVAAAGSDST